MYVMIICDNTSAITIVKDPKYHSKAKHTKSKYHYIRDMLKKQEVIMKKVPSKDSLVNPFMKALGILVFNNHV